MTDVRPLDEILAPAVRIAMLQTLYLVIFGMANWLWLRWAGTEMNLQALAICSLPALCAAGLLFTSTADPSQYALRVMACGLFGPVLLLFWSSGASAARTVWPFVTGAVLLHVLTFAGTVMWAGTSLTRVSAASAVARVEPRQLMDRLISLNATGVPFDVSEAATGEITVWYHYAPNEDRSHAVILRIDTGKQEVEVRERVSANGARPKNASEASMRPAVVPSFDPKRPQAARVYGTVAQTSPIDRQQLAAVPAGIAGSAVTLPADFAGRLDEDGMVTLLCAVVTRSGWNWQPEFFSRD